ncbi:MAG: bifunctional oligoribonuclease/PAP phosphatase NrnA [Lachnospiraceae bacterium]|nr:bifunctional oligoribonuclease/PAP phosphatase NrnA [Lachnospiraceae bacterium]
MINLNDLMQGASRVGIAGHIRPDGDSVGASLGLYNYLKKVYPDKEISIFLEHPSSNFDFLKGFQDIACLKDDEPYTESFDLFFALDLGDMERLGKAASLFKGAKVTVCVDHHISNTGFAMHDYIEPEASSTAELVFTLFDESKLDRDIAECIYAGIIHDTGVFRFSNTGIRTLSIVQKLIATGIDFPWIIQHTFYEKTYIQNLLLGRALIESMKFMDGLCIASVVNRRMMNFYGAKAEDLDGIVNQLILTKGVECAVFLHETDPLCFKVSLRSNSDRIDVARIAKTFNGGGHKRAAGFTMSGTYHDILNNISLQIERQIEGLDTENNGINGKS